MDRREHGVVIGAGMAGLTTARVLSEHFAHVTILEQDTFPGQAQARRGVPQGRHAHGLLAKGQETLEQLFPGMVEELRQDRALLADLTGAHRWYFHGRRLGSHTADVPALAAARPVLEQYVRERVLARSNVSIRGGERVSDLLTRGKRVTGVVCESGTVEADLVVDASGRGSRTPHLLQELGFESPDVERIEINLAYTSQFFRLAPGTDPFGEDIAINCVNSPSDPRGAFFGKLAGDVCLLSLTGMVGDHAPKDRRGFLEFAASLPAKEIHEAIKAAEPVSEVSVHRYPASVRRHYERLTEHPAGLLVIGDGLCSFNPVYGQGMSVAALEAAALGQHLEEGPVDPLAFYTEVAPIIGAQWDVSAGGDLEYPAVPGAPRLRDRLLNAYLKRVQLAASQDGRYAASFFRLAGMVDTPRVLLSPGTVVDVFRKATRAAKNPPTATVETGRDPAGSGTDFPSAGEPEAKELAESVL